ncbi:MAG TPA: hypothetical protein PKC49_03035 [Phycisphaerae bacterium]|nr:hypothetical protein [Phycisphaerae bacterium]
MFLVGRYELRLDAKHRLSIPLAVRNKMNVQNDGVGFYVLPARRRGTLALYPELHFERLRDGDPLPSEVQGPAYEWYQFLYSNCYAVQPDDQSRVLLPKRLLELAGIAAPGDVILAGMRDHLELWSRADFEAFEQQKWTEYPQLEAQALTERQARGSPAPNTGERAC